MSKGIFVTILVLAIVGGGLFYASKNGMIPGMGDDSQIATKELKQDIENLKGNKLEEKLLNYIGTYIANEENVSDEEKEQVNGVIQDIAQSNDISLNYSKIEEAEVAGKGAVKVSSPAIKIKDNKSGDEIKLIMSAVDVQRDASNPNHYFYKESGDLEIYTGTAEKMEKLAIVTYETDGSEIKFSDKGVVEYAKGSTRNMMIKEGKNETLLLSIAEITTEQINKREGGKVDQSYKVEYNGIAPGDMVKMMIGQIDPISLRMDFAYKGDDYQKAIANIGMTGNALEDTFSNVSKGLEGNADEMTESSKTKYKKFEGGDMTVNNFSLLMGDAGFRTSGNLSFGEGPLPYPKGSMEVVLTKYSKLIDFAQKFMPVPQAEVDNMISFMKEIGETNGDDIIFNIGLNGTDEVRIGGKTLAEITMIQSKYQKAPSPAAAPYQELPAEDNSDLGVTSEDFEG